MIRFHSHEKSRPIGGGFFIRSVPLCHSEERSDVEIRNFYAVILQIMCFQSESRPTRGGFQIFI